MLRRTRLRLCEAVSGDKGHMTYAQACTIFGFQLNDRLDKKEIKKRFNKLALKYHPDHGGTSEQFQLLKEAQKIMETHRHDKGEDRATAGRGFNFRKMTYDEATNNIHVQTAENKENRSFGMVDYAVFVVICGSLTFYYFYNAWVTQAHLARSRWALTEDKMKEMNNTPTMEKHVWHPWRADQRQRDHSYEIGVIQGSMKRELLERRQEEAPTVPHPLIPMTPWSQRVTPARPQTTESA